MFAPGHLGELTRIVSFDLVDAVLGETRRVERRVRLVPSRVVVYFLLAMALFGGMGYRQVWARLSAGLDGLGLVTPSSSALRQARRRVGSAPVKALFELVAGPLARLRTPGGWWRGLRVVAFDGTTIAVPDSDANRARYGKRASRNGETGYPVVRLVALVECGTRAMLGALFGSPSAGELDYATRLLDRLCPGMLLLADRNFDAGPFLAQTAATGADLLVRLKANRRPLLLRRLRDGSILSIIAGIQVRIIEATVSVRGADGTHRTEAYRLATTLLDPAAYPAPDLLRVYHQRWEIESAFLAIKDTIVGGAVMRSHDPVGIEQEIWALLSVYQILRIAMTDATDSLPGTDPDRAGFSVALHAARDQVIAAHNVLASTTIDLVGTIGRQILANLLLPRRPRTSPRTVKRTLSKYSYNTRHPTTATTITITIDITDAAASPLTRGSPP